MTQINTPVGIAVDVASFALNTFVQIHSNYCKKKNRNKHKEQSNTDFRVENLIKHLRAELQCVWMYANGQQMAVLFC